MSAPGNEALRLLDAFDDELRTGHYEQAHATVLKAQTLATLQAARELRTIAETLDALLDEARRANE